MASYFRFINLRIASRSLSVSYRPLFPSSFNSHPTATFFKQPQLLLSFASDPLVNRSSRWYSSIPKVQIRRYHQDLLDSSPSSLPTPFSRYEADRHRLRMEIADLLQGSRILERRIGSFDPPADKLDRLGRVFLQAFKFSILAAKESDGQDWEHALYQALLRAAKRRIESAQFKRGSGIHWKLRRQIGLDDLRLATAILKSKSSQPGSSDDLPSLDTRQELLVQHTKEDLEVLLGGDDFLTQTIGQFPPIKLKSHRSWIALKRLVVTSLALSPRLKIRDGRLTLNLCWTLGGEVTERIKKRKREEIPTGPRRVTIPDLDAAEEVLHKQRIDFIRKELPEINFDQVPDELSENVPGVPESEAQSSRFNTEPGVAATYYRRRICELWKNEGWSSEYLFPHFPSISGRDQHLLRIVKDLASITAAQEEGQFYGYPLIVKKAIRRAVLERLLDHDFRDRIQKRSDSQILLEDVERAFKLVEGWRKSNPKEKLK